MEYIFLFIIGLAVGSFLNVVIYRLYTGKSFLVGRSCCPKCKKVLAWYDLIPLVSFAKTLGKCRYCGKKINSQYPLVELTTGLLFVLVVLYQPIAFSLGNLLTICYLLFAICILVVIFVYDLKHFIIPDKVIYPAIFLAFSYQSIKLLWLDYSITPLVVSRVESLLNILLAAGIAGGFFLSLVFFSRGRWMGWGDIKMACFMGLLLGWPNILVALMLSFVLGGIIGLGLILTKKKVFKSQIPFGPFLSAATLISIFWGNKLINWYLSFISYG